MMKGSRGFILLLTLVFLATLTVIVGSMMYMVTYQMKGSYPQTQDDNMEAIADAGIERAHRAIRDGYLTTTLTGVADLRGGDTSLSTSVTNPANMRYIEATAAYATFTTGTAILGTFDSNYTNTKIVSVVPHIKATRTGGSSATVQFAYTLDGTNYTTVLTQALTTTNTDYTATAISGVTWAQLMSANFRLRVIRSSGNSTVNLDAMYLRVTYSIDTLSESWATGSYATFPISLSGGTIQSIAITDEASKIHLNYASQSLLTNLFTNLGIASASTKATNVINYRGASLTNPFDSVEELQQVTGITASDYAAVKDYVTVYSYASTYVYRPTGPRAPININTASATVLKSVFDSLGLGTGDAQSLANDIVTFRASTPFTCFYSSQTLTTDFYDFVNGRSYLTATERNIVLDNCDPSSLIPVSGYAGYSCTTTELCYAGGPAFYINVLARVGTRNLRIKTLVGNDGSMIFSTYTTEPASSYSGWRKENFE